MSPRKRFWTRFTGVWKQCEVPEKESDAQMGRDLWIGLGSFHKEQKDETPKDKVVSAQRMMSKSNACLQQERVTAAVQPYTAV